MIHKKEENWRVKNTDKGS